MTTTVMEHDEGGPKAATPFIVLALGCNEAQQYLNPNNEVLQALCGQRVVRVDFNVPNYVIYRNVVLNDPEAKMRLLERHDLTPRGLHEAMQDASWFNNLAREFIRTRFRQKTPRRRDIDRDHRMFEAVKIVLIAEVLLEAGSNLPEVLTELYPNAAFFSTPLRSGQPRRIWNVPLCKTCGTEMREAGNAYVCEKCGSVVHKEPSIGP